MAKKSKLAETIKYLKSRDMLYIEKRGDEVILLDGHMIVYVPYYVYKSDFMLASKRFRFIEDGKYYCVRNNKKAVPLEVSEPIEVGRFFDLNNKSIKPTEIRDTHVLLETSSWLIKLFLSKDKTRYIAMQSTFAIILYEFKSITGLPAFMNQRFDPVICADKNYGCCLLPVNTRLTDFDSVAEAIEIAKKEAEENK